MKINAIFERSEERVLVYDEVIFVIHEHFHDVPPCFISNESRLIDILFRTFLFPSVFFFSLRKRYAKIVTNESIKLTENIPVSGHGSLNSWKSNYKYLGYTIFRQRLR